MPSRREFLAAVTSLAHEPGSALDCVIVGAGLAGLAAAYRLWLAGHRRIQIFDKRAIPGGICWTETAHGYRFPMGTTYLAKPWKNSAAHEIYSELPSAWWAEIPEPEDSFYHGGQILVGATVFHNWEGIPGITAAQSADCEALRDWFTEMLDRCEWPIWTNGRKMMRYERMIAREMILSVRPDCDAWVLGCIDSFTRGVFNGNLDEISGLQAIDMIGDEYEAGARNITGRKTHVVADLVDALVAEIGAGQFQFGAEVTSVRRQGGHVQVSYRKDGRLVSRRCR